jgi:hypothetical protein
MALMEEMKIAFIQAEITKDSCQLGAIGVDMGFWTEIS